MSAAYHAQYHLNRGKPVRVTAGRRTGEGIISGRWGRCGASAGQGASYCWVDGRIENFVQGAHPRARGIGNPHWGGEKWKEGREGLFGNQGEAG